MIVIFAASKQSFIFCEFGTFGQGRIKAGADGAAAPGPPKNRFPTVFFEFIEDNDQFERSQRAIL